MGNRAGKEVPVAPTLRASMGPCPSHTRTPCPPPRQRHRSCPCILLIPTCCAHPSHRQRVQGPQGKTHVQRLHQSPNVNPSNAITLTLSLLPRPSHLFFQAIHCARMGHDTLIWSRGAAAVDAINTHHQNTVHLPGHTTPPSLRGSTDLLGVVAASEVLLVVVPTQYIVKTLGRWAAGGRAGHDQAFRALVSARIVDTPAKVRVVSPPFLPRCPAACIGPVLRPDHVLVSCSKGITLDTLEVRACVTGV